MPKEGNVIMAFERNERGALLAGKRWIASKEENKTASNIIYLSFKKISGGTWAHWIKFKLYNLSEAFQYVLMVYGNIGLHSNMIFDALRDVNSSHKMPSFGPQKVDNIS